MYIEIPDVAGFVGALLCMWTMPLWLFLKVRGKVESDALWMLIAISAFSCLLFYGSLHDAQTASIRPGYMVEASPFVILTAWATPFLSIAAVLVATWLRFGKTEHGKMT